MYQRIVKPLLFRCDPEWVHHQVFTWLRWFSSLGLLRLYNKVFTKDHPALERTVLGLRFKNPVGLAAGFDKDALCVQGLSDLGFGFIEIGTVTPKPQPGNPKKRLFRLPKKEAIEKAVDLLERFNLTDAANRIVKTYSGGMRRRLDLAASLIANPNILFLDEPTTGLDPRSRMMMWDVIENLVKEGTTVLLTTQYLEEADQLADKIAVIDRGKVIAEGTADELKAQVGGERIEIADLSRRASLASVQITLAAPVISR